MRQNRQIRKGITVVAACCAAFTLAGGCPGLTAEHVFAAEEPYPMLYEEKPAGEEPVMALTEAVENYVVQAGDSLWRVAQKLWGDGTRYMELAKTNRDVLSDPNLIYPGMSLNTSRTGYIVRSEAKYGGFQTGEYSVDCPYGWTVGYMEQGDAGANLLLSGDAHVACLIQDKMDETTETVADWQQCAERIAAYVEQEYPGHVSNLRFEQYHMEGQGDASGEVYLYSCTWDVSPKYPGLTCDICVGLKLTEHIQAEFVGYGWDYDIHSCVRYMTASFEEHFDEEQAESFTANNYNVSIWPESEWEQEGLYDSFTFFDTFFTSVLEEVYPEEKKSTQTPRQRVLERATRPAHGR